jgi:hypothetical protein
MTFSAKYRWESVATKLLIFALGVIVTLGGMHMTTLSKVAKNDTAISGNCIKIDNLEEKTKQNKADVRETLRLVQTVVNQNTVLIQTYIGNKP